MISAVISDGVSPPSEVCYAMRVEILAKLFQSSLEIIWRSRRTRGQGIRIEKVLTDLDAKMAEPEATR